MKVMTPRARLAAVLLSALSLLVVGCPDTATTGDTPSTTLDADADASSDSVADVAADAIADPGPSTDAADASDVADVPKFDPHPSDAAFDPARLLQISITLPGADWDALRAEGRDLSYLAPPPEECKTGPPTSIYTWFTGEITIDGTTFPQVGVRKKGFMGSISQVRPSLKVDFDRNIPQEWSGLSRLTLNNLRQDPSRLRQCLAYDLYTKVGVPAPRCNYAHVTVNGEDLGIFVNIDAIKKPFLRRHFAGDDQGTLYEGQLSDFVEGAVQTFEKKQDDTSDRSSLDALVAAMASPDDVFEVEVSKLLDLPAFYRFWAVEQLIGHWDGYAGNRNNFYVYQPVGGLWRFIAWGVDSAYNDDNPFSPPGVPAMVTANGYLAHRLYQLPAGKDRYVAELQLLLDTMWDEAAIDAEVDRIVALIEPIQGGPEFEASVAQVRGWVTGRRAVLEAELAAPPSWDYPLQPGQDCLKPLGTVSGSMTTTWGSVDSAFPFGEGAGTMDLVVDGQAVSFTGVSAVAGISDGAHTLRIMGMRADNAVEVINLILEPELYSQGTEVAFHGFSTFGVWGQVVGGKFGLKGFVSAGSITLTKAGATAGAEVEVTFTGSLYGNGGP